MKKLLFILTFLPFLSFAQFEPYGHIEYVDSELRIEEDVANIVVISNTNIVNNQISKTSYSFPSMSTKVGIRYKYKSLSIMSDVEVFSDPMTITNLIPKTSFYTVAFEVKVNKNIKIRGSHTCIHSITTQNIKLYKRLYGGSDKIGIYIN